MALAAQKQAIYWGVAAVVFAVVLWFLGPQLLPFIVGGAIAYFLDPLADRLERAGLSRGAATATITLGAILLFALALVLLIPTLIEQAIGLARILPDLAQSAEAFVTARFPELFDQGSTVRRMLESSGAFLQERVPALLQGLVGSAFGIIGFFVFLVIVPVVAVYLLLDWDRMVARIDDLLPRDHAPTIRRLAAEIDDTLASFLRGMGTVCLILGTYYAVALMIVGLDFGLLVGFIAGLVTFIPYLGALIGGALAIGLALFQFWGEWLYIAAVAGIFVAGQVVEGNILTPKLVGDSVGLHPVWLLLALSVFGALFGFVGMLIAVPLAAALGVLARFAVERYKQGPLYRGSTGTGGGHV